MSGPGRIITIINSIPQPWRLLIVELVDERDKAKADLQNPAVIAALPEVQAMIAEAVAKERARIIAALREEADVLPCREDAKVTEGCADLIEADFSYDDEAERIAAIRKRGEGQP